MVQFQQEELYDDVVEQSNFAVLDLGKSALQCMFPWIFRETCQVVMLEERPCTNTVVGTFLFPLLSLCCRVFLLNNPTKLLLIQQM